MKAIFCIVVLFFQPFLLAQYFGERNTEQNFEQSEIYFKSQFLNPYGLFNFKKIAAGYFSDPFLNLYLNPATLPDLGEQDVLVYLDFRGDRTKISIRDDYIIPLYTSASVFYPIIDWRWFTVTRSEPEPIVSLGALTRPFSNFIEDLFFGVTYQLINRQENFYSVPYNIYYPQYYYDNFGIRLQGLTEIPRIDRYYGKDDLSTVGHLFSTYSCYKLNDQWNIGLSFGGVIHSRDGGYAHSYQNGSIIQNDFDQSSFNSQNRNQEYNHFDFSAGTLFKPSEKLTLGLKIGYLKGNAEQSYTSTNNYLYKYKQPNITNEWNYSFNDYNNNQQWDKSGSSKYISLNFARFVDDEKEFSGYYRYTQTNVSLNNSSSILDTSFYTSRYYSSFDTTYNSYIGFNSTSDSRTATGSKDSYIHEVLLNFLWKLSDKINVRTGIYYNSTYSKTNISEPVAALRKSQYNYAYKNNSQSSYFELYEDKVLSWQYDAQNWSLQIPIVFNFVLNEKIEMLLGLNRILEGWEIEDVTNAYFSKRQKNENGVITTENNFIERYTQPKQTITDDFTKIIAGVNVILSKSFSIRMLVDPEFDNPGTIFRLAQWWLSFKATL